MNSINIVGRLGADPELKYSGGGMAIARLKVAVDRSRKDGEGKKVTDWFACKAFGKTAELAAEHLAKGRQVALTGSMQNETWTDNDGKKRDGWELVIDRLTFLDGKGQEAAPAKAAAASGAGKSQWGAGKAPSPDLDDEVPF